VDAREDQVLFRRVAAEHADDLDVESLDSGAVAEIRQRVAAHAGSQLLHREDFGGRNGDSQAEQTGSC